MFTTKRFGGVHLCLGLAAIVGDLRVQSEIPLEPVTNQLIKFTGRAGGRRADAQPDRRKVEIVSIAGEMCEPLRMKYEINRLNCFRSVTVQDNLPREREREREKAILPDCGFHRYSP